MKYIMYQTALEYTHGRLGETIQYESFMKLWAWSKPANPANKTIRLESRSRLLVKAPPKIIVKLKARARGIPSILQVHNSNIVLLDPDAFAPTLIQTMLADFVQVFRFSIAFASSKEQQSRIFLGGALKFDFEWGASVDFKRSSFDVYGPFDFIPRTNQSPRITALAGDDWLALTNAKGVDETDIILPREVVLRAERLPTLMAAAGYIFASNSLLGEKGAPPRGLERVGSRSFIAQLA